MSEKLFSAGHWSDTPEDEATFGLFPNKSSSKQVTTCKLFGEF